MLLPNATSAVLDIRKIEGYCLNAGHPIGRHKARVFQAALGISIHDAGWLRNEILDAVLTNRADELDTDSFGTRYRVDLGLTRHGREAMIRTVWIVADLTDGPRFVTCWVL